MSSEQTIFQGTVPGDEVRRLTKAWLDERWPSEPTSWRIACSRCHFIGEWVEDWSAVVAEAAKHDLGCVNHVGIYRQAPFHNDAEDTPEAAASNGRTPSGGANA